MPKILLPESILKARKAAIKKNGVKSVLPMSELNARWAKKKEHLEKIASNIRSLRYNLTRDLKSDDEKTRLTALVISVMDCSAERVGNEDSESNGHFGVTGFQKKHVSINGNTVTLKYKGKSGVDHEKSFSDPLIASVMKQAIKDSPNKFVFCTSDGFRIRADKVNRYLNNYHITAKDIRGYCANTYIINQLKKQEVIVANKDLPEEKAAKKRKVVFNKAVKYAAGKVGHGPATLKSHYLMPEVSRDYIEHAKITSLTDFFSNGGEVKGSDGNKKLNKPKVSVKKKTCPCKHGLKKPIIKFKKGGLLAPNGKPSNLSPEQYKLVRTPEFKAWFGDWEEAFKISDYSNVSEVLDENWEPLVVYHGTTKNFNVFDLKHATKNTKVDWGNLGFFFTPDRTLAVDFTRYKWSKGEKSKLKPNSRIIPVFLNLRSPRVMSGRDFTLFSEKIDEQFRHNQMKDYDGWIITKFSEEDKGSWIRLWGEDGIKEFESNQYVVFTPEQIKLADGTNTTFDSNNPDIRFEKGGKLNENTYIYHGTGKGQALNIQRSGFIKTHSTGEIKPSVSFTNDLDYAKYYAKSKGGESKMVILRTKLDDSFVLSPRIKDNKGDEYVTFDNVPISKLEILTPDGSWMLLDKWDVIFDEPKQKQQGGLIAPNGKQSNLTPEQYKLVRTPEFKAWFGDWENDPKNSSKVVDDNGEPQVVYHGTTHKVTEFQRTSGEFGSGIYFTKEIDTANYYANLSSNWNLKVQKYIMHVFLNIRNPIEYKIRTAKKLLPLREKLIKKGYDGVIGYTLNDSIEILAFQSNQIKLADGTNITFNKDSPDIRFEKGGEVNNKSKITKIIKQVSEEFMKEHSCSLYDIDNGLCEDFAGEVINRMGGYSDNLFELTSDMFENDAEIAEEQWEGELIHTGFGVWSKKMLDLYGYPPVPLDKIDLRSSNHVWILYNGKHYDAETPNGVNSPWELLLYKKLFAKIKSENNNEPFRSGGTVTLSEAETQIADYVKEGIFLNSKDKPVIETVDISRFNGPKADIFPGQNAVFISGVRKWIKKIKAGRRPYILVDYNDRTGQYHVIDGHHRLSAYQHLGIKQIPVIDRRGMLKFEQGGSIPQRKIIVHNNTASAADRDAQRVILQYLKSMNDRGLKVFIKFLDRSGQSKDNYDTVFYLNKDYHPSHSSEWHSNKIMYQTTVEAAYRNALNADDEHPSFIRVIKRDHVTHYVAAAEMSLFGDYTGDKYDEKGTLKNEVKQQAIQIISDHLKVGKI